MKQKNKLLSFNTTIRNPERYPNFLKVVKEKLDDSYYDNELLLEYEKGLIEVGTYRPNKKISKKILRKWNESERLEPIEVEEILAKNPQNVKGGWIRRAESHLQILREFGFIRVKERKLIVTKLGHKLLEDDINVNEFYTKLLLKVQFGNPFRKTVNNKSNPFLFTLHVINQVNSVWKEMGEKPIGISRTEFQYFVLPMVDNNYNFIAKEIIASRKRFVSFSYENKEYGKNLIDFASHRRLEAKKEIKNIANTSKDYADNVIRHFRLTGLITFRGNARFIDISEGSVQVVKEVFNRFKLEWKDFTSEDEYVDFLLGDVNLQWKEEKRDKRELILDFIKTNKINFKEVNEELLYLGGYNKKNAEQRQQRKTFLKGLENEETKRWWIWKISPPVKLEFLLAIFFLLKFKNIELNPNLLIDDAGLPYYHAPAGRSDIEIVYNNEFNLLVEATLLMDKKSQLYNETATIAWHSSDFQKKTKRVTYAMLIAPFIHRVISLSYKTWIEEKFQDSLKCCIFPLSIKNFIGTFSNSERKLRNIVESKFLEFKKASLEEVDQIINE